MRVVRLLAPGGPEQLAIEEAERPRPGPGEVLVRVLSGVVEAAGPGVAAGEDVFALTPFDRDGVAADYTAFARRSAGAQAAVARARRERRDPAAGAHGWQGSSITAGSARASACWSTVPRAGSARSRCSSPVRTART
jgi:hypothetical protein